MTAVGFPDFRRQNDWDTPTFVLNDPGTAYVGGHIYALAQVGSFDYLAGTISATGAPVQFNFTWFLDSAATIIVGQRNYYMEAGVSVPICIPNMARYMRLTLSAMAAPNFTAIAQLFGSNRKQPTEAPPIESLTGVLLVPALGGGLATAQVPNTPASGRALWRTSTGGMTGQFLLTALSAGNIYIPFAGAIMGANSLLNQMVLLPWTTWRMEVTNTGGAPSVFNQTVVVAPDS